MSTEPMVLLIDEVPVVTVRSGHIDQVDALRAIARGARSAEIRRGSQVHYRVEHSPTSRQYHFTTLVGGPFFADISELPAVIENLEARPDRGY